MSKGGFLPVIVYFKQTPTGARIKREYLEVNVRISGASGCDGQTLDGGAAVEQAEVHRRALVQLGEVLPGCGRVAVSLPPAAAG